MIIFIVQLFNDFTLHKNAKINFKSGIYFLYEIVYGQNLLMFTKIDCQVIVNKFNFKIHQPSSQI